MKIMNSELQRRINNNTRTLRSSTSAMSTMNNADSTACAVVSVSVSVSGEAANAAASMGESTLLLSLDGNEY